MATDVEIVVVGAGIAGLAAARALELEGRRVLVIDAADQPGGVMRTDLVRGFRIERGPNTVMAKAPMLAFLSRLAVDDWLEKAAPEGRSRYLLRGDELVAVPLGPGELIRTPLLSARAKWRLLAEPFVRSRRGDETVADFIGRRLGSEVVDALVGPFLTGVYAGDERELGAEAVFPALVEYERRSGSITLGAISSALRRGGQRGMPGTWSARGGLGVLATKLAEGLRCDPLLSTRAVELARDGAHWRLALEGPEGTTELRPSRLVIACDARNAAKLLRPVARQTSDALAAIRYAAVATVALDLPAKATRRGVDGFGFLVPRTEGSGLLGCLFMSRLFEKRAPSGRDLLHCILGGTRWPAALDLDDEALCQVATRDVDTALGLRENPGLLRVQRWPHAVAQPGVSHRGQVRAARAALRRDAPGLVLAGSYLDGVSVADTMANGVAVAAEIN